MIFVQENVRGRDPWTQQLQKTMYHALEGISYCSNEKLCVFFEYPQL